MTTRQTWVALAATVAINAGVGYLVARSMGDRAELRSLAARVQKLEIRAAMSDLDRHEHAP